MAMSRDQNAGQNHIISIDNKSFEKLEQLKHLEKPSRIKILFRKKLSADTSQGTLATFQCRIFWLPSVLSKNLKINIYRTIIFPVVLYGCETRSLTLREECRL